MRLQKHGNSRELRFHVLSASCSQNILDSLVTSRNSLVTTLELTSLGNLCFARWNKMHSPNKNKTNDFYRRRRVLWRCSHGGRIIVMLLVRFTKGQRSPRTCLAFGDHFASFSPHPLARKFLDEGRLLSRSFLLDVTSFSHNGRTSWWICLQQEGPHRAWSFCCGFQRTS